MVANIFTKYLFFLFSKNFSNVCATALDIPRQAILTVFFSKISFTFFAMKIFYVDLAMDCILYYI